MFFVFPPRLEMLLVSCEMHGQIIPDFPFPSCQVCRGLWSAVCGLRSYNNNIEHHLSLLLLLLLLSIHHYHLPFSLFFSFFSFLFPHFLLSQHCLLGFHFSLLQFASMIPSPGLPSCVTHISTLPSFLLPILRFLLFTFSFSKSC